MRLDAGSERSTLGGVEHLAPLPAFRYVWLAPTPCRSRLVSSAAVGLGGVGAVATVCDFSSGPWLIGAGLASLAWAAWRCGRVAAADRVALVPWGVLVESEATLRALLWASVARVEWMPIGSSSGGMSEISYSHIRIDTQHGAYEGRSFGEAPLAGLGENLASYTEEQAHSHALDLEDAADVTAPGEPTCEPIWRAARAALGTARVREWLALESYDYRGERGVVVGSEGVEKMRRVLRDRVAQRPDRRGLICALAGQLRIEALLEDLFWLVSCPNPTIAALAKYAAFGAGGSLARAGALDEVAPFLQGSDLDFLRLMPTQS